MDVCFSALAESYDCIAAVEMIVLYALQCYVRWLIAISCSAVAWYAIIDEMPERFSMHIAKFQLLRFYWLTSHRHTD